MASSSDLAAKTISHFEIAAGFFQRSKLRQHALKLRTFNEKPLHHDSSASEGLDDETCSPLSKKRKMDGGDGASGSSSLKMQVEEARERQRKEEEERLEREATEAEKKRKEEEEEAREREAREAAEREAKLIKLREEKSSSLGPEPEKGTQNLEPKRRGRPPKNSKPRRGRPPMKIVDKPAVEAEPAVEPAPDGQKRKRGRPPKASKQDFDLAPPCLDSKLYKVKLRCYKTTEIFHDPLLGEPTCSSLLLQLEIIWDQVGESYEERGKMRLQMKEECWSVIKREVEHAAKSKARLLQALADAKLEFSTLLASLGDKPSVSIPEKTKGNIKDQLADIEPALQLLRKEKEERVKKFTDVLAQIEEITGSKEQRRSVVIDESNLSLKKLEEFHDHLQQLQKEKSERLDKVLENLRIVRDICAVFGIDSHSTIMDVHPSLTDATGLMSKSISNDTLARLEKAVLALTKAKEQRLQKLQELAAQLTDLWNLMDTPEDERSLYNHVTCNILSASVDKVTAPGALALALIEQAEVEVETLKTSKIKEIMLKRQSVLDDILGRAHIDTNTGAAITKIMALIDSGSVEPSELLADMDAQIIKAKEEALSRNDILDKVNIWRSDCEEEEWLENRGDSDLLDLERAEKARILVSKIPDLVDTLVSKTQTWEEEHGLSFKYNGAPLLAMLNDYSVTRREREEGRRMSPNPSPACPLSVWTKMDGPRGNMGSNCGQIKRLFINPMYDTEPG